MASLLIDPEPAFEEGHLRCCAGKRKDWPLPPTRAEPEPLREFVWKPPDDKPLTKIGREIDRLLNTIRTIASEQRGRIFLHLMENKEYATTYEHGYSKGRNDGADWARGRWKAEYADVLSQVVQGLGACLKEPGVLPALTAAVIYEELLVPAGLQGNTPNPRFREILKCLKGDIAPDASVQAELAPEDVQTLEAAQWTYRAGLFSDEISLLDLFALADVAASEWINDMREEIDEVLSVLVELNGDPCAQGYFVGWYIGAVSVQTVRSIIETGVYLAGPL